VPAHRPRGDAHRHAERQKRQAGGERAETQDALEIERLEEEHRQQAGRGEEDDQVRTQGQRAAQELGRQQRGGGASLAHGKGDPERHRHGQPAERPRRGPGVAVGLHDGVDEHEQRQCRQRGAADIGQAAAGAQVIRCQQARDRGQGGAGHGNVDEKDPAPVGELDQRAAGEQTGGGAKSEQPGPDGQCAASLRGCGRGGQEQGQGRRRQQRAEGPLERPRPDEHPGAGGDPAQRRRSGEAGQADGEDPPRSEAIGEPAADEEQAAEGQQVGIDHPREIGHREVQLLPDRGQGDVGDGVVDQEHELGDAGEQQDKRGT
jgi:hypothetical protein